MGIKDLNPFLRETVPESIKECDLIDFKGKTIGIDASNYFYKFLYKNDRFLEGFFQQIFRLRTNGLYPIYVFDGPPPPEKIKILNQRKEKKEEMKNTLVNLKSQLENTNDPNSKKTLAIEINKLKKKIIYVSKTHIDQLKELLDLIHVPYIQAPGEADSVLGNLYRQNKVQLILSDDMDLLTIGGDEVLRNFFINSNKVSYYNLNSILKELNINRSMWIDFCILCGCDYIDRIPNLGPKNAIKLLKIHETILNIIVNVSDKYTIPEDYIDKYYNAVKLFNENTIIETNVPKLEHPGFHKIDKAISLLIEKTNLTKKQIEHRMNSIYS